MIGGAGKPIIEQSDIMYQDSLVCILNPNVKKGIIVRTDFIQPAQMDSLCELGLKTGKQLQTEGIYFGRSTIHPYIFFRAPYYSRDIDYSSVETEIISSYGEGQIGIKSRVFIRVDPDRTFVFSSDIRTRIPHVYFHISDGHLITEQELPLPNPTDIMLTTDERYRELYNEYYNSEINKSKKTLTKYLCIIKDNEYEIRPEFKFYNLYSSRNFIIYIHQEKYHWEEKEKQEKKKQEKEKQEKTYWEVPYIHTTIHLLKKVVKYLYHSHI